MHLTKHTSYAIRALVYTALKDTSNELTTIAEMAETYQISRTHLMKIVNQLANNGLLKTRRGKHGGLRLARAPEEIMLAEVVKLMEPGMEIISCADSNDCTIYEPCSLRNIWKTATEAFMGELEKHTLADILKNPEMMAARLGIAYNGEMADISELPPVTACGAMPC